MASKDERSFSSPRLETRVLQGTHALSLTMADMPAHEMPDAPSDNFVICLALRGRVATRFRFGEGWRETVVNPGAFLPITPPQTLGEFRFAAPHRHLILTLSAASLGDYPGSPAGFGPLHEAQFHDPLLARLCHSMWEEAAPTRDADTLYGDCARAMLVASLLRRAGRHHQPGASPFSEKQWRQVLEYIEEALVEPLTVAKLAAVAACSESRLLRNFKARTGQSPYRYIVTKRLERARALLLTTGLPLSEIALRAGFYDQPHFSNAFARQFGTTPGVLRARARN